MTQYTVNDDLELHEGPTLSFLNYGLGVGGQTVFFSKDRAYTLSAALDVVIVFDPTEMEVVDTIEIEPPERPMLDVSLHTGAVFGGSIVWPVAADNAEAGTIHRGTTLLVVDAATDEARFLEDDRCAGSDSLHVDDQGDLYVLAGASWGWFAAYGEDVSSVKTCLLRVKADTLEFDADYRLDLEELTGSYINGPWYHVEGTKFVAHVWDPEEFPLPEVSDDFWNLEGYRPWLVDIADETAEPYPALDGGIISSSLEFEVDGVTYYPLSDTGSVENARSTVVELRPDGITEVFTIPELWALARIR